MKTIRLIFCIAELILAVIALGLAVIFSDHPISWMGLVLALGFGSKGFLYIWSVKNSTFSEYQDTPYENAK